MQIIAKRIFFCSEAEFKEFEPRHKSKPRLKYGWFHFRLYSIFKDLSRRRSIESSFGGFETRLKGTVHLFG